MCGYCAPEVGSEYVTNRLHEYDSAILASEGIPDTKFLELVHVKMLE